MSSEWQTLSGDIDECMLADQTRLHRRLKQLRKTGTPHGSKAGQRLRRDIEASARRRAQRLLGLPSIEYPVDLPVSARQADIADLIRNHQVSIICGETGSGKTTQLPKICLALGRGVGGLIGHTQPRRLAARSVAARLAGELGDEQYVGYKVRFHDTVRASAYIKVMTDGVLLAELSGDRWLERYDTLIIDEAHERSLNIDFLLGYLKRVLKRRPALKLIITSATINAERFAAHFDAAPVLEVSGRGYPISLDYQPPVLDEHGEPDLAGSIGGAVESVTGSKNRDILVFLSGEREIHEALGIFPTSLKDRLDILPLYSRLSRDDQDRVFKTSERQKLILATNVAETSLTIPNIAYVIDTGRARISRYSHRNKIQRLPIEVISRASAAQRMGRCGRTGPGRCIRLYSREEHDQWPEFTEPEVRRTNLAAVILRMKALSLGDIERFPFIDPPDRRFVRDGLHLLRELGALDESDRMTEVGRDLARFSVDPRIARMILAAGHQACLSEVLVIASAFSIQDPFERPRERREQASKAREEFTDGRSDFLTYLNVWRHLHEPGRRQSRNTLRRLCAKHFISWQRFREWEDVHRELGETARELGIERNSKPADYGRIHRALLAGSLGLIGQWSEANRYAGARESQFQLSPGCGLYRSKPGWMMASELVETTRVYAHRGARIRPQWVEAVAPRFLLNRSYSEPRYDTRKGRVFVQERVSLYGLPIINKRRRPYDEVDPEECRMLFIAGALVEGKIRTGGDFLTHNQKVVDGLRGLEHKTRRTEMLEDDATIADLYAARIPADVTSAATFERWRRRQERDQPTWLHFNANDLKRDDAPVLSNTDFPDEMTVDGHQLPLRYRFDPGAPDDGITVQIPLLLINQLPAGHFEALVPGRLEEKILASLRSLPKSLRRNFVPLPQFAKRCHATLAAPGSTRPGLFRALAQQLERLNEVRIPDDSWNHEKISTHLLMNFEVIDSNQSVVATSRDLSALRKRFSNLATGGFEQLTPASLHRDALSTWPDVALPTTCRFRHGVFDLLGFPALVDQGDSVGVRLFDTRARATHEGYAGLRRLLDLHLGKELKAIRRNLPDIDRLKLLYVSVVAPSPVHCFSPRGHFSGSLDEEIMRIGIERCFRSDPERIRDQQSFEQWVEHGRESLSTFLGALCKRLSEVLGLHHQIRLGLRGFGSMGLDENLEDLSAHLDRLVFRGFLSVVPVERLEAYPRYLAAVERRMAKLTSASRKDRRRSNNLRRLWDQCQRRLSPLPMERREGEDVQKLRWMLEELRVATFAQDLGTEETISVERVESALASVESSVTGPKD